MFAIKLNEALNVKENEREKEDDHTKLFPGEKGRHLTDKEFITDCKGQGGPDCCTHRKTEGTVGKEVQEGCIGEPVKEPQGGA
jgi:hypothetical protein